MLMNRLAVIKRASIIAIIINIALGLFKAVIGFITNSVAITTDAINNFTDAGSSLVTILAAFFSAKQADKKHPFGYGRIEYLGTLVIGGLILYAGISSFIEAVKLIIEPEMANYPTISIIILIVAIFVKIALALFTIKVGKAANSDSLVASGKEAVADIAISIATVAAAIFYITSGIAIEAYLGAIIGIFIIKSGIEILKETVDKILGSPVEISLIKEIKSTIAGYEEVVGAYDLVLHDYGPDAYMGSVHIAVVDTLSINEFDKLGRKIYSDIAERFGVHLTAIGLYSVNTSDEETIRLREAINKLVMENEYVNQMHGFYLNKDAKEIRFDLVVSFDSKDRNATFEQVLLKLKNTFPEYNISVGMDFDFNEL